MRTNTVSRKDVITSPVTPAVTGIDYPGEDELSTDIESRPPARNDAHHALYTHSNVAGSTIDDVEPPADTQSLDQLWDTIRLEKERKMAKERPKVQSFEDAVSQELLVQDHRAMQVHVMESSPPPLSAPKSVKRQKSMYVSLFCVTHTSLNCVNFLFYLRSSNFRESTDGRSLVVNFELPDVDKQDIHVSFQKNKLVLTWETAEITEWEEEDGIILRDQIRRMYHRTLPLPDGTRVRRQSFIKKTSDFPDSLFFFSSSSLKKSTLR